MNPPVVERYDTRHGPLLALRNDTYITPSLATYGEYCPNEWLLLSQIVKPGMTVVEVGTNIGPHTVGLARACAPGPLFAFEPQPRVFQILCANLVLNNIANAFAYPEALGDEEGEVTVPIIDYSSPHNFGGVDVRAAGEPGIKVRLRRLDSLDLTACDLLKVDVEGFELQVIRGARETIARHRPTLYLENDRAAHQGDLISLIADMGYRLYWHTPPLFSGKNFKGVQNDIFPGVGSINMICLPRERTLRVHLKEIDPTNWASPLPAMP